MTADERCNLVLKFARTLFVFTALAAWPLAAHAAERWMTAGTKRRPMMPAAVPQAAPRPKARQKVGEGTPPPAPREAARSARPAITAG